MHVALKDSRLGIRNSTTRIPFRYGTACMTKCPQAILEATIETERGVCRGYSGDCLPPSWFDKSGKDFEAQVDDMLAMISLGQKYLREELATPTAFFPAWQIALARIHERASEWKATPLLASFGLSLVERAVMDALARAVEMPFAQAVRDNIYDIAPGMVHASLDGLQPGDWLPARPRGEIFVRHTVGLGDPLTPAEISRDDRLDDGLPQSLEEYVEETGLAYLKIKVSNELDRDLDRLRTIAQIVEKRRGHDYRVTLDGNEQYHRAAEFDELVDAIRGDDKLAVLWSNVLVVEQPLERGIALEPQHTDGIRRLSDSVPVIIDESDGSLAAYEQALDLGYRGISSKNCKGPIKSLLNAGLTWLHNDRGRKSHYVMTGEDLCSVGIIPVQADLCLVATLGLEHVERNGHHFHPGLTYLSAEQRERALALHPDFYHRAGPTVSPRLEAGRFQIGSLQCPGFGFSVLPDWSDWQSPEEWDFASLELAE